MGYPWYRYVCSGAFIYLPTNGLLDHINWIAEILTSALENIPPSTITVTIQVYITATSTATITDKTEKLGDSKENDFEVTVPAQAGGSSSDSSLVPLPYSTILQSPFVEVQQGRPDLKSLISKEVGEATGGISINGI